jgi:hypothetical protein
VTESHRRPLTEAELDEVVTIPVRLSLRDVREINRRAGLQVSDGRARAAYVLGCALGEPYGQLLERVQQIAHADRVRYRAEFEADRAERARKRVGPANRGPYGDTTQFPLGSRLSQ